MPPLTRTLHYCLAGLVLALAVALAWHQLFSTFMPWDDEGVMQLANRMFLSGHAFYRDISLPYGLSYPLVTDLAHQLLGIPISSEWARLLALLCWLSLAWLCAGLLLRLGSAPGWAIAGAGLSVLYLDAFSHEPGHPQGLVALATVLTCLAVTGNRLLRGWLAAGVVAGLILQMKLNAGIFTLGAAALVLAPQLPLGRWRPLFLGVTVLGAALGPFVLMAPLLGVEHASGYALVVACALAAVAITLAQGHGPVANGFHQTGYFAAGLVLANVLLAGYAMLRGISLADLVANMQSYTASQADFFHLFREYTTIQQANAALALAIALVLALGLAPGSGRWLLLASRLVFAALALFALVTDSQANANGLLGWAGPWCWVCIASPHRAAPIARRLLVAMAAWFMLLAYPIPGSQLYFASYLLLPLLALNLADLAAQAGPRSSHWAGFASACLVAVLLAQALASARAHYNSLTPLALPGTGALRLESKTVGHYRALAAVYDEADVGMATWGFNSLYSWSSASAPAPVLFNSTLFTLDYLDSERQQRIRAGLTAAEQPVVLVRRKEWREPATNPDSFQAWLRRHYQPAQRVGPYLVLQAHEQGAQ